MAAGSESTVHGTQKSKPQPGEVLPSVTGEVGITEAQVPAVLICLSDLTPSYRRRAWALIPELSDWPVL